MFKGGRSLAPEKTDSIEGEGDDGTGFFWRGATDPDPKGGFFNVLILSLR